MPRGLQRVIHYVHDFEAAAELYRRPGFAVGPREDSGYALRCHVQVPGFCVELLAHTGKFPLALPVVPAPEPDQGFTGMMLEEVWTAAEAARLRPGPAITVRLVPTERRIACGHIEAADRLRNGRTSAGITATTARGELSIMDPTGFRDRFGIPAPDVSSHARLAAVRFAMRDRNALIKALKAGNVAYTPHLNAIVVGPEAAMGATLVFEPA
jgi:hypothetical protein